MEGLIETVLLFGGVGSVMGIIWAISETLRDRGHSKEPFNQYRNKP